ncbi:MAG TPA: type I phosphomannose isomerase catalytic subunit [Nitriliruptoraceae bacterium]|nr:type I phosphomannose isomerase catalytic subunit [Nitriliruptoraceae bacterium]
MTRVDQPLRLAPVLVPKPWGGRRLADIGRDLPSDGTWGESWDVSDLDPAATALADPASKVIGGAHDGLRLEDLIATAAGDLLGSSTAFDGRFPLLVKTLDARQHLSVQVHPSSRYVITDPSVNLKSESWVVVGARPGAGMWLGLDPDVTPEELRRSAGHAAMTELLRWIPAEVGAAHHLPAGLVHALGAGVMVVEVQTPSDTTFRLYDWTDEYHREPRQLHLAEGRHAMELEWELNLDPQETVPHHDGVTIVDTDAYRIDRHVVTPDRAHDSSGGWARVLVVLDGEVVLPSSNDVSAGETEPGSSAGNQVLGAGGVAVLPSAWSGPVAAAATESATILEVTAT